MSFFDVHVARSSEVRGIVELVAWVRGELGGLDVDMS